MNVRFTLNKQANQVKVRLYTPAYRKIGEAVIGKHMLAGRNDACVKWDKYLKHLAAGAYYYTIEVSNNAGETARGGTGTFIILK